MGQQIQWNIFQVGTLQNGANLKWRMAIFWLLFAQSDLLCLKITVLGNHLKKSSSPPRIVSKAQTQPLPIETVFKLPSPLPTLPSGGGFASGTIDLGGLQVFQISSFSKIWGTREGGPNNLGASFFEPSAIPQGFFMLGCYGQPNNRPLSGWVLVGKDVTGDPSKGALKQPIDYTLVWSSESLKIQQDGPGYIWLPTPPDGYKAIGHIVTTSPGKPSLDKIRCVRSDFTEDTEIDAMIWGPAGKDFNIYIARPKTRGTRALGVPTGTAIAQNGSNALLLPCLKNIAKNYLSAMPNQNQIQALVEAYSPMVYFHPDEKFLPSSVSWFFRNGALLYQKGQESKPNPVDALGSNLPQGDSNDGLYWLDLPADQSGKDKVKGGNLQDAGAYIHIKPMLGAAFTDLAIWVFYPFNGPARAKFGAIDIPFKRLGEHVGDWEHVTLRISNFNGELKSVYFSQHSGGSWVNAWDLEFRNGSNKPVAYSSLHGHAMFPKPGLVLEGNGGKVGIRNDMAKSNMLMDTGLRTLVVSAEHLGSENVEPPWLDYAREWGPKISYQIDGEIKSVSKLLLFGKLRSEFESLIKGLPNEVLREEGPTGPKWKDNWTGDERS